MTASAFWLCFLCRIYFLFVVLVMFVQIWNEKIKQSCNKYRKYHDEITKNMKWHLQENFWCFLQLYFCCLMQLCVILKCKFVCSAARVSPYFFCQRFWFVLSMLVSKFSIAFRLRSSNFFLLVMFCSTQSDHCQMLTILIQTFCFLVLAFIT